MRRLLVLGALCFAFLFAAPAAATPVRMSLSDPNTSFIRLLLVASDGYDTITLENETPPTGGSVTADLLGTLDPGFDVASMSISWEQIEFTGAIPNVGPFALVLDPLEITVLGNPLNTSGRLKPSSGHDPWIATSSTGAPMGSLTVAGSTGAFAFEDLLCPSCASGSMKTTNLTDLRTDDYVDSAQWANIHILTVGDVDFSLTVTSLWIADYTVIPEPGTGLLLAVGLAGLAAARRHRA